MTATTSTIIPLSGSTDGRPIKVAATSTPGTLLHTASATSGTKDQPIMQAVNSSSTDRQLTLEWGGTTDPDDTIEVTIPALGGLIVVANGDAVIQNSLVIRAFAAAANVINVVGKVIRTVNGS